MAEVSVQLHVSCLWHQQVHSGAITSLIIIKNDELIICSLASAATERSGGNEGHAIALLCPKTGKPRGGLDPPGAADIVQLWCQGHKLACCQADGTLCFWPLESLSNSQAISQTIIRLGLHNAKDRSSLSPALTNLQRIGCCTMAHDETWFATGSANAEDGTISIYYLPDFDTSPKKSEEQVVTATRNAALIGHTAGILTLGSNSSQSRSDILFSGSYDATVRVWKRPDGKHREWQCLRILKGHGGGPRCLLLSRNGKRLFTGAADNTIRVWNTTAWVSMRLLHGRHEDTTWPACMALTTPGGRGRSTKEEGEERYLIASGSTGPFGGSTIKLFDSMSGDCVATIAHLGYQERGSIRDLSFSLDGKTLFSAASNGTIAAWSLKWIGQEGAENIEVPKLRKGFL